jgi:hypothetical protein
MMLVGPLTRRLDRRVTGPHATVFPSLGGWMPAAMLRTAWMCAIWT